MTDMNPVPATGGLDEGTTRGINRRAAGLVAGGLVVVLALAAYLLLGGGGSGDDEAMIVPPAKLHSSQAAPSKSAPAATPKPSVAPVDESDDVDGRDPFAALLVEPPAESEVAVSQAPTEVAPPVNPVPTATPAPQPSEPVVIARLTMTSANGEKNTASFKVDGTVYKNVAVGETFGTYFQLYGVFNGQCAGVLYGDSSINLCVGGTVPVYA